MPQRSPIDRRTFLRSSGLAVAGLALAPTILAACGSDSSSGSTGSTGGSGGGSSKPSVQLNWVKNAEFAGFWVADSDGFYEEEGIEVDWLGGGPNVPNTEQITAGGGANLGLSTFYRGFVQAVNAGADVVLLGATFQRSPMSMLSLASNPVMTAEALVGKRIGVTENDKPDVDAILKINGLPDDYEHVPVGYDVNALANGDVDVLVAFITNQALILEEQGTDTDAVLFEDLGLVGYSNLIFANRSYLEANRDTVVGFMRASAKGWEKNQEDPEPGAVLAVEEYGADLDLSLDQQIKENAAQVDLVAGPLTVEKGLLWVSPDYIVDEIYPGLSAAGVTTLPDLDTYLDLSVLEDAYAGKTKLLS